MFYKMIEKKRDAWLRSAACPVRDLLLYMVKVGRMRDAQIEAIKTYLFLKIACKNRSLCDLFCSGEFNALCFDNIELTSKAKTVLETNQAAAALFEYAASPDADGKAFSPKLLKKIKDAPDEIDYESFFRRAFYNVAYTDFLFSLPMGAGKTYLMAAFIYLDLYFAGNEPDNPAFAHNFIIFAPSGLKTSVIPSLRTIQNFDPAWIIPEPAASNLKRKLIFEVLDQNRTANKSNKTKNPNVQKIAIHQPLEDLFGLVAVTNAEKVILDRLNLDEKNGQLQLIEKNDDEKDRQSNELRNLIGSLPHLSVFIDEVHHAATDDKKLRAVVNHWMKKHTLNSVIGFSGTPYLQKGEKLTVAPELTVSNIEISNIVHYYPLVDGIGNFLKKPTVKIASGMERTQIVEAGIREFFSRYKDTVYSDGTCAKLGIYCGGSIEVLEEQIYPLAIRLTEEFGLNASEAVLRFHDGNKIYPKPQGSELQFVSLDQPFSKIRIVLLVQIGKEGWDCRSLTGIILSQEGDCPTNMVLQTSCRCLRQVQKGVTETALIYLNESNAKTLNLQLEQQHHISLQEFERGKGVPPTNIYRYDRTAYLKLPKIEFYQLKVEYQTLVIEEGRDAAKEISEAANEAVHPAAILRTAEFADKLKVTNIKTEFLKSVKVIADYNCWLGEIVKGGFGFIRFTDLKPHDAVLRKLFDALTYEEKGIRYFQPQYRIEAINANIRKAFYEKRSFTSTEELIQEDASLLKVENLTSPVMTTEPEKFYPKQTEVKNIVDADKGILEIDPKTEQTIKLLREIGENGKADELSAKFLPMPQKDRSFHYLPYRTDSSFEQKFLTEVLKQSCVDDLHLEVYYNGDRALTEFKIKCYQRMATYWRYIGKYTPDFLIIRRKDGQIHQAIIVETKGAIYANDPTFKEKRSFMEGAFLEKNNQKFGYRRFNYLYLEDTLPENDRITATANAIKQFFME